MALLRCIKALEKVTSKSKDFSTGLEIVRSALKTPCYFIASNAGFNAEEVVSKLLQTDTNIGLDALTGEYVDMIKSGIF